MEIYTDFRVSYLIQTFVNKMNTKLSNDCQVIPPEFQIFRKNILRFMKRVKMRCVVRIEALVFTLLTNVT